MNPGLSSTGRRKAKHVLVVAQERHVLRLIEVNLQRAGMSVTTCGSLRSAREALTAQRPDLVMLDSGTPLQEVQVFIRELRASPESADVEVLCWQPGLKEWQRYRD